jgi:YHS domain-containing protein
MMITFTLLATLLTLQKEPSSTKEAMKPIQLLVGEWKAQVSSDDGKDEAWEETQNWEYKIDKEEYALQFEVKGSKKVKSGVLSYDLKKKVYRLDLVRANDAKASFEGKLDGKELHLEEVADAKAAQEKVTFNLLRDNRILIGVERKEAGKNLWSPSLSIASTKQGVPFVRAAQSFCVVTGGTPSSTVEYKGVTYNLCCNSCRKEFLAHPEETIARAKKEGYLKAEMK